MKLISKRREAGLADENTYAVDLPYGEQRMHARDANDAKAASKTFEEKNAFF